ncbi:MAG: Flp pilus assembly protein CpaB [Planctomycetota bacterium]|jgi:pilus assembly protein CpaB
MKQITPGTVTVVVLAILLGLGAAYAARHYLAEKPQEPVAAAGPKTTTIVIPRINLPKYARVRDQDVETVEVPLDRVPEDAVRQTSQALFRLVKSTVMAGQPLREEHLFGVGEVPMLSDQLPPGYRAVTLGVDADTALNGMIQPECHVDVALTFSNDRPEVGGLATITLMRGIRVLATSESRFRGTDDRPRNLRNVTVAVTPEQANKLILAQRYGTLSVTLRSTLDETLLAQDDDDNDLVNPLALLGLSPLEPIPEIEPVEVPDTRTVEIWRNGQMQTVTFGPSAIRESQNATAVAEGRKPMEFLPVSASQPTPAGKAQDDDCPGCEKNKTGKDGGTAKSTGSSGPTPTQVGRSPSQGSLNSRGRPTLATTAGS